MSGKFIEFVGNCPKNVAKETKYSVRFEKGDYVVGIHYQASDDEIWRPTSHEHPELVAMVNEIKLYFNGAPGGPFYINEFKQVIVPVANEADYYYAGEYHQPLVFEFDGQIISGEALDLDGNPLKMGDPWPGPHPGIRYVLAAGCKDIYYEYVPRPGVIKRVRLSRAIGVERAKKVAVEIGRVKGSSGGRFYVNEFCSAFAPKNTDYGIDYLFVQEIDLADWFPKPEVGESETAAASVPEIDT